MKAIMPCVKHLQNLGDSELKSMYEIALLQLQALPIGKAILALFVYKLDKHIAKGDTPKTMRFFYDANIVGGQMRYFVQIEINWYGGVAMDFTINHYRTIVTNGKATTMESNWYFEDIIEDVCTMGTLKAMILDTLFTIHDGGDVEYKFSPLAYSNKQAVLDSFAIG